MSTLTKRNIVALCIIVAAEWLAVSSFAIEVTELAGAAHGYPGFCDSTGKKLADGEFRQWLEGHQLHIVITYDFPDGRHFEENAVLRQGSELVQEKWSWKELEDGKAAREFAVDFLAGTATARIRSENKDLSEKIDIEPGRTFAGFGFTLAIANLRKRLINGEPAELKAVGFTPKPRVVTVKISYVGLERMKMSGRLLKGDNFLIRPEIPSIAKLFVRVPDTHVWLTNPPPAGFLRWEGPIALPSDPLVRVDLVSGSTSGPAEPVNGKGPDQSGSPHE